MNIGTLDRRIALQRATVGENEYGDTVEGWSPLAEVWANYRPAAGRERFTSAEIAASMPAVFRIRWSPTVADLNAKDRIEYPVGSGRLFGIVSVNEIGRREGLEIIATSRADAAAA